METLCQMALALSFDSTQNFNEVDRHRNSKMADAMGILAHAGAAMVSWLVSQFAQVVNLFYADAVAADYYTHTVSPAGHPATLGRCWSDQLFSNGQPLQQLPLCEIVACLG